MVLLPLNLLPIILVLTEIMCHLPLSRQGAVLPLQVDLPEGSTRLPVNHLLTHQLPNLRIPILRHNPAVLLRRCRRRLPRKGRTLRTRKATPRLAARTRRTRISRATRPRSTRRPRTRRTRERRPRARRLPAPRNRILVTVFNRPPNSSCEYYKIFLNKFIDTYFNRMKLLIIMTIMSFPMNLDE